MTKEECGKWLGRIELAKLHQARFGDTDGRWTKHVKALAGDFDSKNSLGDEAIDVNLTQPSLKTMLSPMWVQDPHIAIRPTTERYKEADNVRRAEVTELELNYWFRELEVKKIVKVGLYDMMATNHMYACVGYVKDKAEVENTEGERTEPDPTIQHRRPFVKRLSPKSVLTPPGYCTLEEHPWIAIITSHMLDDLKDRYKDKAKDIQATKAWYDDAKGAGVSATAADYMRTDDCKMADTYQVWDKRAGRVYLFADGCEEPLSDEGWDDYTEGFPIVHEQGGEIPDEYHGTPPMQYWMPQQIELNACRTAQRGRFNRTKDVLLTGGNLGEEFKGEYAKAKDNTVVSTGLAGDQRIQDNIMNLGPPNPDPNVLVYEQTIKVDLRDIMGLGSEQRGSGDPNIDSATASANVEKWARVRASDLADRVRNFYVAIARKLWMLLKQHPNEKRSRLIAGALAGQFTRVEYTLADLEGEFAFEMDLTAMLEDSPQARLTQAMANYNMMRADPLVNAEQLVLDVFKAQNKPDLQRYLQYLRTPNQELEMVLNGLPVEAHERDDDEMHVKVHDTQMAELEGLIGQEAQNDPNLEGNRAGKMRLAMALMLAHVNDHARQLQKIVGLGQPAGKPQAENSLRAQKKGIAGAETDAELKGQPLNAPQVQ